MIISTVAELAEAATVGAEEAFSAFYESDQTLDGCWYRAMLAGAYRVQLMKSCAERGDLVAARTYAADAKRQYKWGHVKCGRDSMLVLADACERVYLSLV